MSAEKLGPWFDLKPYERPDGTLDDGWVDGFLRHAAMRAMARQGRKPAVTDRPETEPDGDSEEKE